MATTQDIIRRLVVVAEERGLDRLQSRLQAISAAGGSVADANAVIATSTDRSERAVTSATRAFEGLERRFIPAAREAHNLDRALQQVIRFGEQTGQWGRAEQLFDTIARSSSVAAENVERLAMAQRGMAEHFRNQVEQATGVSRTPASRMGATGSALAEQAAEMDKLERQARELLQSIDPVGQAQARLLDHTANLNKMLQAGLINQKQFADGLKLIEHNATLASKGVSVTTSQFTNLGFQLNDVVSGLAMGQSPMTILVQQGGQVYQALQGPNGVMASIREVGSRALQWLTPVKIGIAGAAAAAIYAATAYNRYADMALKAAQTTQGLGRYLGMTTEQFLELGEAAGKAGGNSTRNSTEIATSLARGTRIGADNIKSLTTMAKDFGATFDLTGDQIGDALTKAFSSQEGITNLSTQLNFLTGRMRQSIADFTAQGKTADAAKVAIDALRGALVNHSDVQGRSAGIWERIKTVISDADLALGRYLDKLLRVAATPNPPMPNLAQPEVNPPLARGRPSMQRLLGTSVRDAAGVSTPTAMQGPPTPSPEDIARTRQATEELAKMSSEAAKIADEYGAANPAQIKFKNLLENINRIRREGTADQVRELAGVRDWERAVDVAEQTVRSYGDARGEAMNVEQRASRILQIDTQLESERNAERIKALETEKARLSQAGVAQTTEMANINISRRGLEIDARRADAIREDINSRNRQIELYGKFGDQQEIANRRLQVELQYRGQRMELSSAEIATFERMIAREVERNNVMTQGARIYGEFVQPAKDLNSTIEATNLLLEQNKISWGQAGAAILDAQIKAESAKGTLQGGINASILQLNKDMNDSNSLIRGFSSTLSNNLVSSLASITDGTKSAREGFKEFGASVLRAANEMIIKMLILGPIMRGLSSALGFGGTGDIGTGLVKAGARHGGGLMNLYGAQRYVHPAYFENAPRFHNGGLASGEIPAILRANEEVLTPDNPRHIKNASGGEITINVNGARGNTEIMDMVSAGVKQGIGAYDSAMANGGLARRMSNVRIRGQR